MNTKQVIDKLISRGEIVFLGDVFYRVSDDRVLFIPCEAVPADETLALFHKAGIPFHSTKVKP